MAKSLADFARSKDTTHDLRYYGDLSAESWKMHYIGLGHRLERVSRFAPGGQAADDDKGLKSPFP